VRADVFQVGREVRAHVSFPTGLEPTNVTDLSATFEHPDNLDSDEIERQHASDADRLLRRNNRLVRWAIDVDQDLLASDGPASFTDAKDAGLSIRVPTSMAVETRRGGHIINSNGLEDEKAWGKPADWCDYNGPVDGEHLGVAMLDQPRQLSPPHQLACPHLRPVHCQCLWLQSPGQNAAQQTHRTGRRRAPQAAPSVPVPPRR